MYSNHLSDGLAELARASEQTRDAALLRATTELFVLDIAHDRDEIKRYEELATHFLPKVPAADRLFVAERLAMCSDAPPSIVRTLARDIIDVAGAIIRNSPVLGPIDLLAVIAATGVEHHRLVARRPSLTVEVTRALYLTGDPEVLAYLNDGASMRGTATEHAIDTSAADRLVTYYPGNGGAGYLDPWRFASLDRKSRLRVIAEIAAHPPMRDYASTNTRLDRAFRSILSAAQIVGFARSGQVAAIIAAVADGLELPTDLVAAGINDATGELLAVMLKALRLDEVQARQVFLLASPSGRDVGSFFPLSDLYAGMEPTVAETLVEAWRRATARQKPGHEQYLAENADRRRAPMAQPQRQGVQMPDEKAKRA